MAEVGQSVGVRPGPAKASSSKSSGTPRHTCRRRSPACTHKAVAGKIAVKRNRFIALVGGTKIVNRELEAKARGVAGWKGYTTNLVEQTPQFVIGAPTTSCGTSRRASGCPSTT